MRNLLSANFFRLRRNLVFWVCTLGTLAGSAAMMFVWCHESVGRGLVYDLDTFYFRMATIVSLLYAVFACLFLSVEYGEGTVRNKLAVGHTRRDIYLSHLATVFAASLCIALAWLAGDCVGIPFLGFLTVGPAGTALCVAVIIGFTASFSAVFTLIGMLNNRRSVTVIMILVWLAILLLAAKVDSALYEPEFTTGMTITAEGAQVLIEEPNPFYISGIQRDIYEFILDLLPGGQAAQLQNLHLDRYARMLLCDLFVTLGATLGGLYLFQRKDLK